MLTKFCQTICFVHLLLLPIGNGYGQPVNEQQPEHAQIGRDTSQLRVYCHRIDSLRQKGNYDSLYTLIQQALPIAVHAHSADFIGQLYYRSGQYYIRKNLLEKGIDVTQHSLRYFRQTRDTTAYTKSLYLLARLYAGKSDYERAIKACLLVLSLATKTKHASLTTAAYSLLIAIYTDLHDRRSVTFYTDQYLHYATRTKSLADLFSVQLYKAESFERQSKYRAAWPYYIRALKLADIIQPGNLNARIYERTETLLAMENNLRHRHQYREGEGLLKKAIQINEQIKDIPSLVNVWNSMALNYQYQHLNTKGLQAATQALAYAKQVKATASILLILPTLAAMQKANGYYRQALATQTVYMRLKDSLLTKEKNDKIAQLQASFDVERKDQLIQFLHKSAQLDQARAQEQTRRLATSQMQRLLLGIGTGVLGIVLGVVVYLLRQSRVAQAKLVQQTQQIESQAAQLQASNEFKDRLFSIISHDLRSPLASLKSSLLLDKVQMASVRSSNLDKLDREVTGLQYTLDNMLYWSLSQRDGLHIRLQPVDLADVVTDVLESFDGLVRYNKLTIHFSRVSAPIKTDENLTLIVLRNILHNAIKFTPPGGHIYVLVRRNLTGVEVAIKDEGPGMAIHHTHGDFHGSKQGTGLGLLLSKELLTSFGGSLQIESKPEQGTTVILNWPSESPSPVNPYPTH